MLRATLGHTRLASDYACLLVTCVYCRQLNISAQNCFEFPPGVQIIWSNSRFRLYTSAALQLQLFVSDLPLHQSEYTADTLSSNQNRVDRRKWNFNVIFTLAYF